VNFPQSRPNRYGLDPWAALRQRGRQVQALNEGEEWSEDPVLPVYVMRGIFSFLHQEATKQQKAIFKKRGQKIKATTPLPRRREPIRLLDWAEAFNVITDSFIKAGTIKRPTANKTLTLTPEGVRRQRSYYYEDQKVRTRRIMEVMERIMDDLVLIASSGEAP